VATTAYGFDPRAKVVAPPRPAAPQQVDESYARGAATGVQRDSACQHTAASATCSPKSICIAIPAWCAAWTVGRVHSMSKNELNILESRIDIKVHVGPSIVFGGGRARQLAQVNSQNSCIAKSSITPE
jgi:hypothetical protein